MTGAGMFANRYPPVIVVAVLTLITACRRNHVETVGSRQNMAPLTPVSHWDLKESNGKVAADESGNAHQLVLENGPQWVPGIQGNGLQFDGVDDYASAGIAAAVQGPGAFSVAAWVKTSSTGEQVILQQRSPEAYDGEYVLQTTEDGQIRFWTLGDALHGANATSSRRVNDGNWHQILAVREANGTANIYVDGQLDGTHAAPPRTMAAIGVFVGADVRDGKRFFRGVLDDIRIYDRALTATDVKSLASQATGQTASAPIQGPRHFYVTPQGSPTGDGSCDHPWALVTVLTQPSAVMPGATIWVREGVYKGKFHSQLTGTAEAPITVRAFPGEHVQIDLFDPASRDDVSFFVFGNYSVFQGLEVMSSDPAGRTTSQSGSFQTDVRRGGISVRGHHNKFINLVVHDLNTGLGYWGEGGEVYGSIFYNNGWLGPDRSHGHGLYIQNEGGVKRIEDNVTFNQFGAGIHAYGSSRANLRDVRFEGNSSFNNGAAAGVGYAPERDLIVGGEMAAEGIVIRGNFTYQANPAATVDIGYTWGKENRDIRVQNNYFVSQFRFLQSWDNVEFTGNTLVSPAARLVDLDTPTAASVTKYVWDNNHYLTPTPTPFAIDGTLHTLDSWRTTTQFDAHSTCAAVSSGTKVFVRPNKYEQGRAHVVIYNWDQKPHVDVDLSPVLRVGDVYQIHSVLDVHGAPLVAGKFDGQVISIPMDAVPAPAPTGSSGTAPVGTDIRFGTFLVTSPGRESSPLNDSAQSAT